MKLLVLAFAASLLCKASGQYFSEGWKPGQSVSRGTGYTYQATATGVIPQATELAKSPFDLSAYLESGPLKSLFNRLGVNISEKLATAREQAKIWDDRVPFIHDDNYNELIVNEEFATLEEERDRVWFLVITVSSAQQEGSISRFVDGEFDKAFNLTLHENDLPHVRWGRIDYMNVTALTTKWAVWRAPYLVVLKDRGQTLRFYRPHQIRLNGEVLRQFLKVDGFEQTKPWKSAFAPGGPREFVLDWLAVALTKVYNVTIMIPRWALLLISGTLASLLVNILHRSTSKPSAPTKKSTTPGTKSSVTESQAVSPDVSSTTATASAKAGGAKQRKGGKM